MRQASFKLTSATALLFSIIIPFSSGAQDDKIHDSSYYVTYHDMIIPRLYLSKKNTSFTIPAIADNTTDLKYKANNRTNLGVGIIYKAFSLNLGYDFNFVNPTDHDEKGDTKGLNMQFHIYPRKWVIDAVGLFQKGFYLTTEDYFQGKPGTYTHRPDVRQNFINVAAYRLSNPERFSYRAAMIQNEWQKKSAGSFLYGAQAYYGLMKGDSALVPKTIENKFSQAGVNKINFVSGGVGIGYAYTLVIDEHFFIMASLIGNANLNFANEEGSKKENKAGFGPGAIYKASVGYNSGTWSLSGNYAGNSYAMQGPSSSGYYFMPADNFRLVLEKKFRK